VLAFPWQASMGTSKTVVVSPHLPPSVMQLMCCLCCAGGKLLVLYGGISRSPNPTHETVGREVAVLNMETMLWDKPGR
jgi:hypothetical protein